MAAAARHVDREHVRQFGYDMALLQVDALSSSANNARQIRDAIMAMPAEPGAPRLVLIGYSKGGARHPRSGGRLSRNPQPRRGGGQRGRRHRRLGAGQRCRAVPGRPAAALSRCDLRFGRRRRGRKPATGTRKAWLAQNPLPRELRYYSLVTFPQPERISSILKASYNKLARIDARNDSQVIFYDQVMPGSTLVGYINADHWALAVPIARTHATIGSLFVTQNAYPREALLEAMLRFVEEDLAAPPR